MMRRTLLTAVGTGAITVGLLAGGAVAADRIDDTTGRGTTARDAGTCDGTATCDGAPANGRAVDGQAGNGAAGSGWSGRGGVGEGGAGQVQAGAGDHTAYASGELTAAQEADLLFMVQEEKLAFDLYVAFGEEFGITAFERISRSEAQHMDAIRTLLDTYGLADPTVGLDAGEFVDEGLAQMYDDLLAQGMVSADDALAVGRAVELDDIAALEEAAAGVTAEDVQHVYSRLTAASEKHLVAFGG